MLVIYNEITDTELELVESMVKLESEHLAQIAKQVQKLTCAKNMRIKMEIDPSLIVGFTIRHGNGGLKFINMSVVEEITTEMDLGDIRLTYDFRNLVRIIGGMKVKAERVDSSTYATMLAAQDVSSRCKELGITALHIKLRATGGKKTKTPSPGA
ncbi:hypothetical protein LWI28_013721 [Acer negundo]|uniref:Uncharacterized protein n=1 Tax=Acer negundo TaxID=4023 RepID=A0AAD5IHR8_ACENE|nr:hypothetical protein LWI28_013721 [Acer negundo]